MTCIFQLRWTSGEGWKQNKQERHMSDHDYDHYDDHDGIGKDDGSDNFDIVEF